MITNLVDWAAGQILEFDPEVQTELTAYAGKLIQVELVGVGMSFYLQPTLTGLQCFTSSKKSPDAVISGTPISLAVMGVSQKFGLSAKPPGIEIRGDAELVHQLTLLMKKFRIDWEEIIAQVVGDRAAQQVGSKLRMASHYSADVAQRLQSSAIDYIQEEIKLLPPKEEVVDFMADVDELRDRVERLLAVARSEI